MPPRKSTSSIPPTDNEPTSPTSAGAAIGGGAQITEQQLKAQSDGIGVEDLLLPRSVTQRLAKSVLPPNTTIQKDALLAIQKAATVFVSYLSSHANEATLKRTIAPSDIISALSELEFESFRPRLERELDAHMEVQADKKRAKEKKAAAPLNENQDGLDGKTEEESRIAQGVIQKKSGGEGEPDNKKHKEKIIPTATMKGNKRVKRDSNGIEKSADDTELEEPDEDETEEEEEEEDDEDDEGGDEDDEENDDIDENETQSAEDLDRVEDLDARMREQDDSGSDDDDDDGPAAQLRSNMGLG